MAANIETGFMDSPLKVTIALFIIFLKVKKKNKSKLTFLLTLSNLKSSYQILHNHILQVKLLGDDKEDKSSNGEQAKPQMQFPANGLVNQTDFESLVLRKLRYKFNTTFSSSAAFL